MAVDEGGIGELPEVLARLEFRRVRRQEEQMDVVRNHHRITAVPARAIEQKHELLGGASARCLSEGGEFGGEQFGADATGEVPDSAARGRMDERHQIAPLVARLDQCERALAGQRPDAPHQRLEADTMLVGRPEFDLRSGKSVGDRTA